MSVSNVYANMVKRAFDLEQENAKLKAQLATAKGEVSWTTQKPDNLGWYWLRLIGNKASQEVVLAYIDYTGNLAVKGDRVAWMEEGFEWQGPLEPKEPA